MPARMRINPFSDAVDFFVTFITELLSINLLLMERGFFLSDLSLPRSREDRKHIIMQVAAFERFPFVLVKPDPAAVAALIERETETMTDLVADQNAPTFRTVFQHQRAG